MVHWPQSRLTVAGAAAGGGHLAGVAAEPGQVPGGVFGADISFGCHHGVSFGHASRRPIRTNPAARAAAAYRQNTPNPAQGPSMCASGRTV